MGVFIRSIESPDCEDMENICGKVIFRVPSFGVLGAWMTFKKAEMEKTLRNGLSLSETDPLNQKKVGFRDLVGTCIAPVSNNTAVNTKL